MAIIGHIRERMGIFVVVIISLAIVSFLLMDALNSQTSSLFRRDTSVVQVNGHSIDIKEFTNLEESNRQRFTLLGQGKLDEQQSQNIREQTYNELVQKAIMDKKYEDLDIKVTDEEMVDLFNGKNAHSAVKQQFVNKETGQFDPLMVTNYVKSLDRDKTGESRQRFTYFTEYIKQDRYQKKFNTLIKKAIYIPKWMAEMDYADKNTKVAINYVTVPYAKIADSTIKVTDAELKEYIEKHKAKYQQEESRKIEYVTFDLTPSDVDRSALQNEMMNIKAGFINSKNDSDYVATYSEENINGAYQSKAKVTSMMKDSIFSSGPGKVIGPFLEGDAYKLIKVAGFKSLPDSVRARHILIKVDANADTSKANRKIDSLWAQAKKGTDFGMLALINSQDDGSKVKMGDLGFFAQGMMVPEFNDACFNGKKGDIVKVRTQFGVHLIQITDQKGISSAAKFYTISKKLLPSSTTQKMVYSKANEFVSKNTNKEQFDKAITDGGLNKRVADNIKRSDNQINGLGNCRELVRWVYEAKKGVPSDAKLIDNKYVIAVVTDTKEAGLASVDNVRTDVEMEVRKEKKAQMLIDETAKKIGSANDIAAIAQALGDTVSKASQLTIGSPFIPASGYEPTVIGTACAAKPNTLLKGVKGERGIYYMTVMGVENAPALTPETLKQGKMQLQNQFASGVDYSYFEALKKQSNLKDNRSSFF